MTRWRLTRPAIGAITWVNSMLSLAAFSSAFGLHLGGMRRLQGLAALIDDGFGDGTGLDQGQRAIEFAFGEFGLGARIGQLAVGLLGDRFERTGIDHVEQIAGLDEGAVAELDAVDEAADAGANLDLLDRLEPAGEFIPIRDGALHRLRDGDRRRRGRGRLRRLVAAAGQRQRSHKGQRREAAK